MLSSIGRRALASGAHTQSTTLSRWLASAFSSSQNASYSSEGSQRPHESDRQQSASPALTAQREVQPVVPPPGGGPGSFESADSNKHWLDRRLPGLRQWLEDRNRHWWIKGLVEGRCRQYHQLEGREHEMRQAIERAYQSALGTHQAQAVDERAETHVQVACLVLATHKALLPYLRDEREVLQIIREHMGGRTTPLLRFLLRATKFMHRDGYATMAARLGGLQADMGAGFATRLELGESESSLTISRCIYHDIFSVEGHPHLAACCCCSQDGIWFEQQIRGVQAGRTAAISEGDPACCFTVRRVAQR